MVGFVANSRVKLFISIVSILFVSSLALIANVAYRGVESQYNFRVEDWGIELFFIQGAWVFIYSLVITVLVSLPIAFYLFAPKSNSS